MDVPIIRYDDIVAGLRQLELPPNPVLLAHSSLKSLGFVEGGGLTVIRALLEVCGKGGTLVMPTLTFRIVDEQEPLFDVKRTPTNTGHIPELFRTLPEARRSGHIFSSCAAIGKHADYITSWHEDTPCGPGTPYHKVIELEGYSLFIGAGFQSNTLFHAAEEAVNPFYLRYKTIENATVINRDESVRTQAFRRYDCSQNGIIRRLDWMEPLYRSAGALDEIRIGAASVRLLSAQTNFRISSELLRNNPGFIIEHNGATKNSRRYDGA